MIIADGNLTFAVINALSGQWSEQKTDKRFTFKPKESDPLKLVLQIDNALPYDCKITFNGEICFIEFDKIKYRLWYMDNTKDIKLELHSEQNKIKLEKIRA
jgi:hypothetical protein